VSSATFNGKKFCVRTILNFKPLSFISVNDVLPKFHGYKRCENMTNTVKNQFLILIFR
jgi:hypothetical protein